MMATGSCTYKRAELNLFPHPLFISKMDGNFYSVLMASIAFHMHRLGLHGCFMHLGARNPGAICYSFQACFLASEAYFPGMISLELNCDDSEGECGRRSSEPYSPVHSMTASFSIEMLKKLKSKIASALRPQDQNLE